MMKWLQRLAPKRGQRADVSAAPALDVDSLCGLMQALPIGARIQYHPGVQPKAVLDSVILGYYLDGHAVYANSDVLCSTDDGHLMLRVANELCELSAVREFSLIVPATPRGIERLNYDDKSLLGQDGGLVVGNDVSVFMAGDGLHYPWVEAQVQRRLLMTDGVYRRQWVAMLALQPTTFRMADKRRNQRLRTQMMVTLNAPRYEGEVAAEMLDYSDRHVRLRLDDMDICSQRALTLALALRSDDERAIFSVRVLRQLDDEVVLYLDKKVKATGLVELDAMDLMQLKCVLLQHPATHVA